EGIVPGGGTAFIHSLGALDPVIAELSGDQKTGAQMLRRALEEPLRRICANAGAEGSVVVEEVKRQGPGKGYDAAKGEYADMVERGIIDPLKVTRSALENAASIATMILTTETLITELPEKNPAPAAPPMPEY
ncbi:MAG TPA: TCP-1/cpn60 chaperonin family protein, partial [Chloroflexota bacterium]|nr:TCP-1/cpn60 chaperonin family protein [Chloroflexota bacterium]